MSNTKILSCINMKGGVGKTTTTINIADTLVRHSIYSQAALLASNYYLVPIAPDVFSTLGYSLLHKIMRKDYALRGHDIKNIGIVFTLCKEDRLGRIAVQETFEDKPHFENKITEYERIRTGKLATLMYDMEFSKDEIISLCDEFITKVV